MDHTFDFRGYDFEKIKKGKVNFNDVFNVLPTDLESFTDQKLRDYISFLFKLSDCSTNRLVHLPRIEFLINAAQSEYYFRSNRRLNRTAIVISLISLAGALFSIFISIH